jgi:hypothetical protein
MTSNEDHLIVFGEAFMTAAGLALRARIALTNRLTLFALGAAFVALVSCGGDSTIAPDRPSSASQTSGGGGGAGNDTSGGGPPATSNGPVASVVVSPKQVSIPQGYYTHFIARPLDAKGVLVAGKKPQWRSSNANVAVASDTGIVYGKAMGTAKIYATVDGFTDSASISVTAAAPPPPPPDTGKTPPAAAAFALNVVTVGVLPGPDTSATEPVGGVTVTVTRVASVTGDTLRPSIAAGTAVTNARGEASFKDLPGGYYTILATPPAASPYRVASWGLTPPRTSEVNVRIVLPRK